MFFIETRWLRPATIASSNTIGVYEDLMTSYNLVFRGTIPRFPRRYQVCSSRCNDKDDHHGSQRTPRRPRSSSRHGFDCST